MKGVCPCRHSLYISGYLFPIRTTGSTFCRVSETRATQSILGDPQGCELTARLPECAHSCSMGSDRDSKEAHGSTNTCHKEQFQRGKTSILQPLGVVWESGEHATANMLNSLPPCPGPGCLSSWGGWSLATLRCRDCEPHSSSAGSLLQGWRQSLASCTSSLL